MLGLYHKDYASLEVTFKMLQSECIPCMENNLLTDKYAYVRLLTWRI